jgi:hypothetical protein
VGKWRLVAALHKLQLSLFEQSAWLAGEKRRFLPGLACFWRKTVRLGDLPVRLEDLLVWLDGSAVWINDLLVWLERPAAWRGDPARRSERSAGRDKLATVRLAKTGVRWETLTGWKMAAVVKIIRPAVPRDRAGEPLRKFSRIFILNPMTIFLGQARKHQPKTVIFFPYFVRASAAAE